jgi:PAS domain-containing protein
MDLRQQAVLLDGRWLIISVMRNVTDRKLAEQGAARHRRMYAALSDTNEAIMHAGSARELYQRVCDAAVDSGGLVTSAVLVPGAAGGLVRVEAMSGAVGYRLREVRISIDDASPEGRGLVGTAFRQGKSQLSNDFLKDERTAYWHAHAKEAGIRSAAAIPLLNSQGPYGVLLLYSDERRAFDHDVVKLLERMAENISFALGNLERDAERRRVEAALRESEARFRALTHLSSDWYWEQDAELRFTRFDSRSANRGDLGKQVLGQRPWELAFEIEAGGEVTSFRSLLEVHQPFRDVVQSRLGSDGHRQYFSVSGEPLFGHDGRFSGYRGV